MASLGCSIGYIGQNIVRLSMRGWLQITFGDGRHLDYSAGAVTTGPLAVATLPICLVLGRTLRIAEVEDLDRHFKEVPTTEIREMVFIYI